MTMQTLNMTPARINRFKGAIMRHAIPLEVLSKGGRQITMPKNSSNTYVGRRWLPWGAPGTDANGMNRFFTNGTGDRANQIAQAHLTQEGVTVLPDSITPMETTVVMQQYSCLYGYTDWVADLYEDDVPEQMAVQVGERVTLVNEMIVYGTLKACTNQYFGGAGTSRSTVNGAISLGMLQRMTRVLQANHGKPVNKMLAASNRIATTPISLGYIVYASTDLEQDIRLLTGFTPIERYASGTPMDNEIGSVERFRFITTPEFPALQDAGAAVGATGLQSTSGVNIDVYQFIVAAMDAWSQVAIRGKEGIDTTDLPTGQKSKADPFGQRGYAGAIWWKAVMIENAGWMAVGNVGIRVLAN